VRITAVPLGNTFALTEQWSIPHRASRLGAWEFDVGGKVHRIEAATEHEALRLLLQQGVDVRRIRASRPV
jgi:hypothetical protein